MTERLDCVIAGAGVVGLAIARSLAKSGREVLVLESEPQIGMHSSSRNSEVIHAGLYYPDRPDCWSGPERAFDTTRETRQG